MKAGSYGLRVPEDFEFEAHYKKYLGEKYGIISYDGGCMVSESFLCYSNQMYDLIKEKYGDDIFDRARAEAKKTYDPDDHENYNLTYVEIASTWAYLYLDSMPEYPGGPSEFYGWIESNLVGSKYENRKKKYRFYISFLIDESGGVIDPKILKADFKAQEIAQYVLQILPSSPKWSPGTFFGKTVKTRMTLGFEY